MVNVFLSSGMAEILLVPVPKALVIPFAIFIVKKDSSCHFWHSVILAMIHGYRGFFFGK